MDPLSIGNKQLLVVGDRVLVEAESGERTTEVGLILPANAVAKEAVQSGIVKAVGPGTPLPPPSGEVEEEWQEPKQLPRYLPMEVRIGDYVTFFRKAAIEITVERTNYLVVPQHAILVLLRDGRTRKVPGGLPEELGEL
jgi:co-chaperonin GroES (HSP10)